MGKKIKAVCSMYIAFENEKKKKPNQPKSTSVSNMRYIQSLGTSVFKMCSQKA